jgi:hypothetical protein
MRYNLELLGVGMLKKMLVVVVVVVVGTGKRRRILKR